MPKHGIIGTERSTKLTILYEKAGVNKINEAILEQDRHFYSDIDLELLKL